MNTKNQLMLCIFQLLCFAYTNSFSYVSLRRHRMKKKDKFLTSSSSSLSAKEKLRIRMDGKKSDILCNVMHFSEQHLFSATSFQAHSYSRADTISCQGWEIFEHFSFSFQTPNPNDSTANLHLRVKYAIKIVRCEHETNTHIHKHKHTLVDLHPPGKEEIEIWIVEKVKGMRKSFIDGGKTVNEFQRILKSFR